MNVEFRKPSRNEDGTIDCEINHPVYGWIPFTASPDDCMKHGQELFAILDGQVAAWDGAE